jgi:nucleoid-associated protein EbfC
MDYPLDIDELEARLEVQRARIAEMQQSVQQMEVTGRSRNSEVLATLRGTGQFTRIAIHPRTFERYDAESIGRLVLEAVNDGLSRFGEASRAKYEPLMAEQLAREREMADRLGVERYG